MSTVATTSVSPCAQVSISLVEGVLLRGALTHGHSLLWNNGPHQVLCVRLEEHMCVVFCELYKVVIERLLSLKPCEASNAPVKHAWEFQLHA